MGHALSVAFVRKMLESHENHARVAQSHLQAWRVLRFMFRTTGGKSSISSASWSNKGLQLTASSVRSCVASASGSR
jgi:hypothetical protein